MKKNENKFSVGDKVILIEPFYSFDTVGQIMVVTQIDIISIRCKNSQSNEVDWGYLKSRVRPLTKLDKALQ